MGPEFRSFYPFSPLLVFLFYASNPLTLFIKFYLAFNYSYENSFPIYLLFNKMINSCNVKLQQRQRSAKNPFTGTSALQFTPYIYISKRLYDIHYQPCRDIVKIIQFTLCQSVEIHRLKDIVSVSGPRAIFLRILISSWIGGYNTDTLLS